MAHSRTVSDSPLAISQALQRVRDQIAEIVVRRGDGPHVELIGVSKRHSVEAIAQAQAAGLRHFAENYAQEFRDKQAQLADQPLNWHFVGGLQTNKVKYVIGRALIHTADRPRLLDALQSAAASAGITQELLVEVNFDEAQKSGVLQSQLPGLLAHFAECPNLRCRGLMCIPPRDERSPAYYYEQLAAMASQLAVRNFEGVQLDELSMGMSADFEAAIMSGATMVRVGTAIFGQRPT